MVDGSNRHASYGVNNRSFRVGSKIYGRDVECRLLVFHHGHVASACMDAAIRSVRCRLVFSSTEAVIRFLAGFDFDDYAFTGHWATFETSSQNLARKIHRE